MSKFETLDIHEEINRLEKQIQNLYQEDDVPWIVGYSGGKDSTATLQLTWSAIEKLPPEKRHKKIYVISTDTLVENPVVAMWVTASLEKIKIEASKKNLPFFPNRLTPEIDDSFWVNLIGRGYPAPRPKFRWCTERLKITPANKFIMDVVSEKSQAIMLLGVRKAESAQRKHTIEKYENSSRTLLDKNSDPSLAGVWIYGPIKDWANDDVWEYLATFDNPWGYDNKDLIDMYRAGTEDNECPLVMDKSTPSCGDSRFGCFVCTLVDKDKSMEAMITNDAEKKWMTPLSEFRNKYLDITDDHKHRDFRRRSGAIMLMNIKDTPDKKLIPGPYKQSYRRVLLTELLKAQEKVRSSGVKGTEDFVIIADEELRKIRSLWINDNHEIEDWVPEIYEEATGRSFKEIEKRNPAMLSKDDLKVLKDTIGDQVDEDHIHYKLVRNLLHLEHTYSKSTRRTGIYEAIEKEIKKGAFENEHEAITYLKNRENTLEFSEVLPNPTQYSSIFEINEETDTDPSKI